METADRHTRHIQALRDAMVAEHEDHIAEVQSWADAAKARGDQANYKLSAEQVERLKAMPYPWEKAVAS